MEAGCGNGEVGKTQWLGLWMTLHERSTLLACRSQSDSGNNTFQFSFGGGREAASLPHELQTQSTNFFIYYESTTEERLTRFHLFLPFIV